MLLDNHNKKIVKNLSIFEGILNNFSFFCF